jgi:uncharacterized RDD family membrane protein YckC
MNRVGFLPRLLAFVLDVIILTIPYVIIPRIVLKLMGASTVVIAPTGDLVKDLEAISNAVSANAVPLAIASALTTAVFVAYWFFEAIKGASVGKMFLKLRITGMDGNPAPFPTMFARMIVKSSLFLLQFVGALLAIVSATLAFLLNVSLLPVALLFIVSCFMALRASKLALHDDFLKTQVVGPERLTFGVPSAADLKVDPSQIRIPTADELKNVAK